MHGIEHNGDEELTLLELVLQLHGEFRRSLEPIRVTPLQAGVLLYLHRHRDAKLMDAAAALRVRQPTLSEVVNGLVRKRWVTKRRSVMDPRAVCLSLSRRGLVLTRKIEAHVRQVSTVVAANKDLTAAGLTRLHRVPDKNKEASS
ncbi:MAG TPA: MarR family transcriptional regulator [Nitrospiraceae bacterium]|jgi:DNA-binding MarR family transcriptional regulator|nr:MarR family transcriptional regulator [Nitrospiraceae bacterium]